MICSWPAILSPLPAGGTGPSLHHRTVAAELGSCRGGDPSRGAHPAPAPFRFPASSTQRCSRCSGNSYLNFHLVLRPLQSAPNFHFNWNCPCQHHQRLLVSQSVCPWIVLSELIFLKHLALLTKDSQNMVGNRERMVSWWPSSTARKVVSFGVQSLTPFSLTY